MERITFLELNRRKGQTIIIGDNIYIRVKRINEEDGVVHFGIKAPKEVRVLRGELLEGDTP